MNVTTTDIDAAVELASWPTASAQKRGRRPEWPYVPVLLHAGTPESPKGYQEQIRGAAFATRDEAVAFADRMITQRKLSLADRLRVPQNRALREHHGLPRDLAVDSRREPRRGRHNLFID